MDEWERQVFALLIERNEYPRIELIPPDRSGPLPELWYSEMTGWQYKFTIAVDSPAVDAFRKTGAFRFKVGDLLVQTELDVGLDNVVQFQDACRNPSSR